MHRVLTEHERVAAERLAPAAYDYYATGAGDEVSLAESLRAWRRYRFRPRVLRDVTSVDTSVTLYGTRLDTPVLVAPTAFHRAAHPDGECETARGAAAAGSLLVLSSRSSRRIEDVAAAATGPWWFQVYLLRDPALSRRFVGRAVDAGAGALVLTVDTPFPAVKARPGPLPVTDGDYVVNVAEYLADGVDIDEVTAQDPSRTVDSVGELCEHGIPVLVKGVLRGDDADACLAAGASGVIVSNHGGRQLDQAVDTATALTEVVAAVGGRAPVLVDGGIRTGRDVLTALALGADAVLLGRPVLWALAADGATGVAAALDAVREEFAESLALAGLTHATDVPSDIVAPASR